MAVEQPTQALERLALSLSGSSPLLFADLVDGLVERLDDVEAVKHQRGIWTVCLDGTDIGLAHVAAGGPDSGFLVVAHSPVEEPVDRLSALALGDPDHAGSVQVVDQRGVLVALVIRDFVNADGLEPADAMTLAQALNRAMQQIRQGRSRHTQQFSGRLLRHDLAVAQHQVLQAVGDPSLGIGPGQALGDPAVGGAADLARPVHQPDRPGSDRNVTPVAGFRALSDNCAAPATLRAATAVFVGLDKHVKSPTPAKGNTGTSEILELEQLCDKLEGGHGASLLCCLFWKTKLYRRPHDLSNQTESGLKSVARPG